MPRLNILRGLSIWDFGFRILRNKEAQEYKSSSQETNHNILVQALPLEECTSASDIRRVRDQ